MLALRQDAKWTVRSWTKTLYKTFMCKSAGGSSELYSHITCWQSGCEEPQQEAGLWSRNSNFGLQLQRSKLFGFGSSSIFLKFFGFGYRTIWSNEWKLKTIVSLVQLAFPTNYLCWMGAQLSDPGSHRLKLFGSGSGSSHPDLLRLLLKVPVPQYWQEDA